MPHRRSADGYDCACHQQDFQRAPSLRKSAHRCRSLDSTKSAQRFQSLGTFQKLTVHGLDEKRFEKTAHDKTRSAVACSCVSCTGDDEVRPWTAEKIAS